MADYKFFDVWRVDKATVLKFRSSQIIEDINLINLQELGDEMLQIADDDGTGLVVINFEAVELFSSAALGKLILLDKKSKAKGGRVRLSNINPNIREIFSLTKLDRLFDIFEDESDAIAAA